MDKKRIELYGTQWCMKSASIRNYLQSQWIDFDDFNVEVDIGAANRVRALYDGELKFPTIMLGNKFLKNPTKNEIDVFITENKI